MYQFEWDENKNQQNIKKHGIDFNDAPQIFKNKLIVINDDRFDYKETRTIGFGNLFTRIVCVVFTKRNDIIRIISLRKANNREVKFYENQIKN